MKMNLFVFSFSFAVMVGCASHPSMRSGEDSHAATKDKVVLAAIERNEVKIVDILMAVYGREKATIMYAVMARGGRIGQPYNAILAVVGSERSRHEKIMAVRQIAIAHEKELEARLPLCKGVVYNLDRTQSFRLAIDKKDMGILGPWDDRHGNKDPYMFVTLREGVHHFQLINLETGQIVKSKNMSVSPDMLECPFITPIDQKRIKVTWRIVVN